MTCRYGPDVRDATPGGEDLRRPGRATGDRRRPEVTTMRARLDHLILAVNDPKRKSRVLHPDTRLRARRRPAAVLGAACRPGLHPAARALGYRRGRAPRVRDGAERVRRRISPRSSAA